ncbi:sensor histidine kinase [Streptomyces sp. HNM0574]|uniref:sensor histidine kinase n=1 Tax=Streptomyces sp. HNM0574 TaxID=2714954 RepID=UPI00146B1FB6|nr:sensor histidine kinase [Streptomyces sp. HNM0574]NLU70395.1 two-component sensor histidine kinase [Streptomyces sp. HNM0574]
MPPLRTRPFRGAGRTPRDWLADIGFFLFAAVFSVVTADSVVIDPETPRSWLLVDQAVGALACASVFLRRRWPVPLAVLLLVTGMFFHFVTGATLVVLFTVAAYRSRRLTAAVASISLVQFTVFLLSGPEAEHAEQKATGSAFTYFALVACAFGWGLYVRSRRALVASWEARARQAAAEARRQAREEIAREMHDVLAHRLSLLSVHAGALEFNPGAGEAEVRSAAGVIRSSAHQALQDLREVIGVLRAPEPDPAAPERPQPGLADVARLAAESRDAGADVTLRDRTAPAEGLPATTGRTAYRIVQEALTNARKHAPGAPVTVTLSGAPGEGLSVGAENPVGAGGSVVPGAGLGLVGLAERAELTGGELEYGVRDGVFRLRARLPWTRPETGGGDAPGA